MSDPGSAWPSLTSWHPTVLVLCAALLGVLVLARLSRARTRRQLLPWWSALALTLVLLASDVQATSMVSYRSHMIEHLIVVLVIAPLIAGGSRVRLSRGGATSGLIAFTMLVPLYHLTRVGAWVMQQEGGHLVEILSFGLVGVWFWLPVYGLERPMDDTQRLAYTFIAWPVIATTGLVLWSSNANSVGSVGMTMASMTLGDLRNGGVVMIEFGSAMMLAHLAVMVAVAARHRRQGLEPVGYRYARV